MLFLAEEVPPDVDFGDESGFAPSKEVEGDGIKSWVVVAVPPSLEVVPTKIDCGAVSCVICVVDWITLGGETMTLDEAGGVGCCCLLEIIVSIGTDEESEVDDPTSEDIDVMKRSSAPSTKSSASKSSTSQADMVTRLLELESSPPPAEMTSSVSRDNSSLGWGLVIMSVVDETSSCWGSCSCSRRDLELLQSSSSDVDDFRDCGWSCCCWFSRLDFDRVVIRFGLESSDMFFFSSLDSRNGKEIIDAVVRLSVRVFEHTQCGESWIIVGQYLIEILLFWYGFYLCVCSIAGNLNQISTNSQSTIHIQWGLTTQCNPQQGKQDDRVLGTVVSNLRLTKVMKWKILLYRCLMRSRETRLNNLASFTARRIWRKGTRASLLPSKFFSRVLQF